MRLPLSLLLLVAACSPSPPGSSEAAAMGGFERTALHAAAAAGDIAAIDRLLSAGAELEARDAQEWTPLHLAALNDRPKTVAHLVAAGAELNPRGRYDLTPLHWAALRGAGGAVMSLVGAGADIEAQSLYGTRPLHESGSPEVAQRLLRAGARLDSVDNWGMTPLHRSRSEAIAKVFVAAGADMMATSRDGRTPVNMLNTLSDGEPEVLVLPRSAVMRLRYQTAEMPIEVRNLEARTLANVRIEAEAQTCAVTVEPPALPRMQPGQLATFVVHADRLPDEVPTEDTLDVLLLVGTTSLQNFGLRLNTQPHEVPEDSGMIRVGALNIRPPPNRWRYLAYVAGPLLLWAGWLLNRRRRTSRARHARDASATTPDPPPG